jgi:hypothetical protein
MTTDLKTGKPFPRGAKPTPRYKLLAAFPHQLTKAVPPPQVITIPSFLEMWLNDQDGDCVTAEEAAAKAVYSVANGLPETKITDATVSAFCNAYGFLNGANLTDVMDKMISDGFQQDSGYKDGPYTSVDYSNETILQDAISVGPVKIGIDASALPSGAGNGNGWYASGGTPGQFTSEDHCVGLWGYGPSAALFAALNVPVPAGFPASGYLLYTWSSIGVVDHAWIMSTCGEAWLRNPTTVGIGPPLPSTTVMVPNVIGDNLSAATAAITGANLTVGATTGDTTQTVASTSPVMGSLVPTGSAVSLVFGTAPPPIPPTGVASLTVTTALPPGTYTIGGTQVTGTTTVAELAQMIQGKRLIGFSFFTIFGDLLTLLAAVQSGNSTAITAALQQLLTDLGISSPATP